MSDGKNNGPEFPQGRCGAEAPSVRTSEDGVFRCNPQGRHSSAGVRVAFVGSRTFDEERTINNRLHDYNPESDVIVSGGARGADRLSAKLAQEMGFKVVEYLPDWDRYGKRAGFLRNQTIVDNCDRVVAFWDGESRGTADTIERARRAGKPVTIIKRKVTSNAR